MKTSNFTGAQKAFNMKQRKEGARVAEICRKAGIALADRRMRCNRRQAAGRPIYEQPSPTSNLLMCRKPCSCVFGVSRGPLVCP